MKHIASALLAIAVYHCALGIAINSEIRWSEPRSFVDQVQFVAVWPVMMSCTASVCRHIGFGSTQYGSLSK